MKKYIKLGLLIIWLGVIYYLSSQNGEASADLSNGLLKQIADLLKIADIGQFIETYKVLIRKLAHFIEYFVLGVLLYINMKEYTNKNVIVICIVLCALYATSDEIHQLMVSDRAFMISDIILDTFGGSCAILLSSLISRLCCQEKKH